MEALIEYLKNGRLETAERWFFLRVVAPQGPLGTGGVDASVALYLQNVEIKVHRAGSHTLRHTSVQRLIEAEFPLKTIGDHVGHRRSQSTEVYAKVAIETLRERLATRGIELVSPHRWNRSKPSTQDGRALRRYRRRWKMERTFA